VVTQVKIRYTCRIKGHSHASEDDAQACINKTAWLDKFDERQRAEIAFAVLYAQQFGHGTDGHNAKLIIAKMADMLSGGQL
jgi:hypothetical protein